MMGKKTIQNSKLKTQNSISRIRMSWILPTRRRCVVSSRPTGSIRSSTAPPIPRWTRRNRSRRPPTRSTIWRWRSWLVWPKSGGWRWSMSPPTMSLTAKTIAPMSKRMTWPPRGSTVRRNCWVSGRCRRSTPPDRSSSAPPGSTPPTVPTSSKRCCAWAKSVMNSA